MLTRKRAISLQTKYEIIKTDIHQRILALVGARKT